MEPGLGLKSSPFTSRLNSNYVATDSESLQIQTLLKSSTSHLEELSKRVQEVDEQLTQIKDKQTSLALSISKHRALISLVRKLPIDILQKIFVACLPTTHNAVMSNREPPMLLTQVCSAWRNVAHATPQLWKSMHIAVPYNTAPIYSVEYSNFQSTAERVVRRRTEAMFEWIKRSGVCPLDISLSQRDSTSTDGFHDEIIKLLIQFSERWRQVSFSAPYHALAPVAALPTSKVPLLESLSLNCTQLYFPPAPMPPHIDRQRNWITSGVMKAPKLRSIYLTQLNEDATLFPINWSRLTNLSLEGTSWNLSPSSMATAYKMLSSCWNLVSCRLETGYRTDYREEPFIFETSTPLISLPFLTKFSVSEGISLAGLLALFDLPLLISLEFHTAIWPTQQPRTSLLTLLTHSESLIQHLTTDAQFFQRHDFIECLRLCPFLKSLAIRGSQARGTPRPWFNVDIPMCRIDDAFLKMLTSSSSPHDDDDDEGCLCPNLENFECSTGTAFSETALLQFVKRKNDDDSSSDEPSIPGLAKLKSLFVIFHRPPLNDITPELEVYGQAGLDATLVYPHSTFTAAHSSFSGLPIRIRSVFH